MPYLIHWLDQKYGRRYQLAKHLGISRSAVTQMLQKDRLPAAHLEAIFELTGIGIFDLIKPMENGEVFF